MFSILGTHSFAISSWFSAKKLTSDIPTYYRNIWLVLVVTVLFEADRNHWVYNYSIFGLQWFNCSKLCSWNIGSPCFEKIESICLTNFQLASLVHYKWLFNIKFILFHTYIYNNYQLKLTFKFDFFLAEINPNRQ